MLREACDRHGVLLIADEIAVGFGRTGTLFACEQAGIRPDFLCLSKGLTGGYLPLSVVLTTETVYQAFYDDYVKLTAFLHSHSYTGNPLACAAALATLGIFRDEDVIAQNRVLAAPHGGSARAARRSSARRRSAPDRHDRRGRVRQGPRDAASATTGASGAACAPTSTRSIAGALLRPIGNVVYLMPPYVIDAGRDRLARGRRARRRGRGVRLIRVHVDAPLAAGRARHAQRRGHAAPAPRAAARGRRRASRSSTATAQDYPSRIADFGRGTAEAEVERSRSPRAPSRRSPSRWCRASRARERMDLVVQKATELGVAAIVPVATARSVVRLDAATRARKRAHWRGIAVAACEQCGRARVPARRRAAPLAAYLADPPPGGARLLLSPDAQASRSRPSRGRRSRLHCWSVRRAGWRTLNGTQRSRRAGAPAASGRACCAARPRRSRRSRCCSRLRGSRQ